MPSPRPPMLGLIAAVAEDGAIGRHNDLLFHDPRDQKHFRATTVGCPVIMGRRTWDSLPERFRPLPGRRNIVVTRNAGWQAAGAEVAHSMAAALALVADAPKAFVIGGGELYALALPEADELVLTHVACRYPGADTFFPDWPRDAFQEASRTHHEAGPDGQPAFDIVTWRRQT